MMRDTDTEPEAAADGMNNDDEVGVETVETDGFSARRGLSYRFESEEPE